MNQDVYSVDLIPQLAEWFGVSPSSFVAAMGVFIAVSNILSRLIPDDAVGVLGYARRFFSIAGLYVSNRVTSGVTVNAIATSLVAEAPKEIVEAAAQTDTLIPASLEEATAPPVTPAFPGFRRVNEELNDDEKGTTWPDGPRS